MTKEDKQLLLKDLCARLPYNVLVLNKDGDVESFTWQELKEFEEGCISKPYLRLMSSMTEEEKEKLMCLYGGIPEVNSIYTPFTDMPYNTFGVISDWLNAHHFDYRTTYDEDKKKYMSMIEKGLALEAPEGMYNIK